MKFVGRTKTDLGLSGSDIRRPPDVESRGKAVDRVAANKNEPSGLRPPPQSWKLIRPTSDFVVCVKLLSVD